MFCIMLNILLIFFILKCKNKPFKRKTLNLTYIIVSVGNTSCVLLPTEYDEIISLVFEPRAIG